MNRSRVAATLLLVALLAAGCARPTVAPPTSPMARDQLFFVGQTPEPLLLALVFQRHQRTSGATLEAKAFTAFRGAWVTPFWERVELDAWPGDGLDDALARWQQARTSKDLRLSWSDDEAGLDVMVRSRTTAIQLVAGSLPAVAVGEGPHGPLAWRAGPAIARVDGRKIQGLLVAERLTEGRVPDPIFGRFEMWLVATRGGGLLLGRKTLSAHDSGEALLVAPNGSATVVPFDPTPLEHRTDPDTGFALPTRWRLGATELARQDGEAGRGRRPDGGPAIYDVCHALSESGGTSALIVHLQDQPG